MNEVKPKNPKITPKNFTIQNMKKPLIGGGIIIIIAISGIFIGINLFEETQQPKPTFFFGVGYNLYAPDPLKAFHVYDGVSVYIIQQIVEGLFATEFINGGSRVVGDNLPEYLKLIFKRNSF